ncbi:hypothetical protein AJ80_04901 [Polytolypa hystricis UAMH7299]|uniref:Cleft lip and palate transmembrane protein 1 n=1 Tax=Polytolypa hystricis (strain UAMH7299) TaxID=1447883 RepID=A0A2B7Y832_POLH7|nr:hypothetical protein AJ80_04901 [Polytolypa hystricis UAMH7299]
MPPQPAAQGQEERAASGPGMKSIIQGFAFFMVAQFFITQFLGPSAQKEMKVLNRHGIPEFADRPDMRTITNATHWPLHIAPIWPEENSTLDISLYISPSPALPSLKSLPKDAKILEEKNFTIGDFNDDREVATTFRVPKEVQQNGTLWAHFYIGLTGHQLDPRGKGYSPATAIHFAQPLNHYLPKKKTKKLKNLLSFSEPEEEDEEVVEETPKGPHISSYYHPNFTVSVIPDAGTRNFQTLHPAVRRYIQLERTGARDASGQNGWYYPIFFVNTFWQLRSHMTELNSTVEELPIRISLNNLKNWKFGLISSLDESQKQSTRQAAFGGPIPSGSDGSEVEMLKEVLLDSNIYLLATTGVVSILHMIFEMLAFKNDISHWRKKKDIVGTSVRTILANVFMQAIIFLYLLDNSEGTSWMILAGQGFGVVLEAWKITKMVDVRVRPPTPGSRFSWLPYHIVFEDKHKLSETEKKTQEYDQIAFRYLYIIAVPLLLAYAAYSLVYESHKSWYSFVIETLVGSVYAYGFLMMVPSLYINYRLKSVAHMPGKAMMYKFLNTFIDDLFAFTIKMPTLHRLATLRDDVIFFVWLYQAWKYKVDYKRVNEFGQGGDDDVEPEADSEQKKVEGNPATKVKIEAEVSAKASGSTPGKASTRRRK